MMSRSKELKFLLNNILNPVAKIDICLGQSDLGQRCKKAFSKRSWKRLFIPSKKYNCSIIELHKYDDFEDFLKTVKGKNSADYFRRRSMKLNYFWAVFDPNEYLEDIYRINTSVEERQGRQMDQSYKQKVNQWPQDDQNVWIGVFNQDGLLVSYVWLIFMEELILINRILGEGTFLKDNIMYLNVLGAIEYIFQNDKARVLMYDTFGRKLNGLVLFKKRIGFKPYTVNFV
ncbi:MAG: hypothetical protein J0G96_13315 [Flavobacteriia bacterium]|nr:hypothetical protein [Flavobacteriia bacterium]OJX37358.1 MAG: hypothetical protein BGO87_01590 [Flavobacteriia bacterium 40-80]